MENETLSADEGVVIIRLDTIPTGYIAEEGLRALHRQFRIAEHDPATRVVIITGSQPGVFVRHFDLTRIEETALMLNERGDRYLDGEYVGERPWDTLLRRIETSRVPVIAAMGGFAEGIGLELALACDFRVAQRGDFLIGLPEVRIGALPVAGGTQRLTRLVGAGRAMDLIMHGRQYSPDQALEWGVVHEVAEDALQASIARANDLVGIPALALSYAKRAIRQDSELPLRDALDSERRMFMDLMCTPELITRIHTLTAQGLDLRSVETAF